MILHRCPWCGRKIPFHPPSGNRWEIRDPDVCSKCKKPYKSSASSNSFIFIGIALIGAYLIHFILKKMNNGGTLFWFLGMIALLILIIAFVELCRIPYARYIAEEKQLDVVSKRDAEVQLSWENHQEKGLLLPRFRVLNGEIFPACFMDIYGTPISTAYCVVLEDLLWSDDYHCSCKIQFVLDDVPEESLFQQGNQFYLYYNYRKIASGVI